MKRMTWQKGKGIKRKHEMHQDYWWSYGQRLKNLGGHWCDEHSAHLDLKGDNASLFLNTFLGVGCVLFSNKKSVEQLRDVLDEVLEVWP